MPGGGLSWRPSFLHLVDQRLTAHEFLKILAGLNSYGYDFTVAGRTVSPEHCLEQTQLTDSVVVAECPKKS